MNRFMERLRALNAEWNDLPRRLMLIVALFGCLLLVLVALPYAAPFVLAALLAWMIEPAVRFASGLFGGSKLSRNIASGVFVVLVTGAVIVLLLVLIGRVIEEAKALAIALPGWIGTASGDVINWLHGLELEWAVLDEGLENTLMQLVSEITSLATTAASRAASSVARFAWRAAALLPQGILFVVLLLMGTYYMSADKVRIFGFLKGLLPEKHRQRSTLYRASILRAVFGQLRAALIMMTVIFAELSIGFLIMGLEYAILFALLIAVLDALPVLGAGLFLIPMFIYGVAAGDATFAVGGALLYVLTIALRQVLEPRIIGRQLGLYPLATMMAMYAGLHAVGFAGMLLGPLMLLLCKVVLTADPVQAAEAAQRKPLFPKKAAKR